MCKRFADMTPAEQTNYERILRDLGRPDSRPHPLNRILDRMADSGRALITHDGKTVCEPLVEVEMIVRPDGSARVAA